MDEKNTLDHSENQVLDEITDELTERISRKLVEDQRIFSEKIKEILERKDQHFGELIVRMEDVLKSYEKKFNEAKLNPKSSVKKIAYLEGLIDGMKMMIMPLKKYYEVNKIED